MLKCEDIAQISFQEERNAKRTQHNQPRSLLIHLLTKFLLVEVMQILVTQSSVFVGMSQAFFTLATWRKSDINSIWRGQGDLPCMPWPMQVLMKSS